MNEIQMEREMYVAKSNELIQKSRYSLTVQQQRILLYMISKIKPTDTADDVYTVSIEDFCRVCGMEPYAGDYYKRIKADLKFLRDHSIWVKRADGSEATVAWFSKAVIVPLCGTVSVKFDEDMMPYLFRLKNFYTQYKLENVLAFRGKYSVRLYEILRSYYTQRDIDGLKEREVSFSVEEIRSMLLLKPIYPAWAEFERRVIKPSCDEINLLCDEFHLEYEVIKEGHRASLINFILTAPQHRLRIARRRSDRLNRIPNHSPVE